MVSRNKFWCKTIITTTEFVVAICDEELLGRKIKIDHEFSICISENFYKEKLIDKNEALELMKKATILNLFGRRIIEIAKEIGLISSENVIYFDGVPHAQFIKI